MANQTKQATSGHWLILLASAVLEAVWALSLNASDGFSRPGPTVLFLITVSLSMVGLALAMRGIPISVAYAVWTGTGAALTVTFSMVTGAEPASALKIIFIAGIIGCVIGLKFARDPEPDAELTPKFDTEVNTEFNTDADATPGR